MCKEASVVFTFLSPYSLDFNPIEESFAQLKAWIKKNREMAAQFDNYEDFLHFGLKTWQNIVKKHFSWARIGCMGPRDDDDMDDDYQDDEMN